MRHFWTLFDAIVLTPSELAAGPAKAARIIVHEATHARIHAARIPYKGEFRERIERVCLMEEKQFVSRLPASSGVVWSVPDMSKPWWTAESSVERYLFSLRASGAPRWILWLACKLAGRRKDVPRSGLGSELAAKRSAETKRLADSKAKAGL